jgi:lipopolysaccharide assembly outer membrane protein LptD (OstA)
LLFLLVGALSARAQSGRKIDLLHADETEFIFSREGETRWVNGAVIFQTTSGLVYCDSAMWVVREKVVMRGNVIIDDAEYRLVADSVDYDIASGQADALGGYVELWSRADSLFAIGSQAFFDRGRDFFYMMNRPTVFLNYPDSARMIEVIADYVQYDRGRELAEAEGSVVISSEEFTSTSGCAVMAPRQNTLDLFESPILQRKQSQISGKFITVASEGGQIQQVDVIDSARGEFVEATDSLQSRFDRSILSGNRLIMDFVAGDLRTVTCYGQAYSWYFPAPVDGQEQIENEVSGDTIRFNVANEELRRVDVVGGAIGSYLSSTVQWEANEPDSTYDSIAFDSATLAAVDSSKITVTDTIHYNADFIAYSLIDSLITLHSRARTTARDVSLEAFRIQLDTKEKIIEAYSASVGYDSLTSANIFEKELQPNEVPVILQDKSQNLVGDYLRYSLETEKGRIVKSKSDYETGFFYGEKLHRQHRDIYYLQNGRYTTCDANEPHFHFKSSNLKLIEGNKLIAKPVVLNIGRLPILALPYYVFPLEKGRHSGLLPFTLGNIEKGERYIRNVGYYWAASEYWDWQGALDYFEDRDRLNLFSKLTYRKRYAFDGSIQGNYGSERGFDNVNIREYREKRWTLKMTHNHEFSPSFRLSATGDVRSDPTYYNDYSTDLEERLNRVVRSQVNFTKKFGRSVSVSGSLKHDDYLDEESRTDLLPTLNVSLPAVRPFGSGSVDENGQLQRRWYNELIITYRPSLVNYSTRTTEEEYGELIVDTLSADTSIVIDSLTLEPDTTITYTIWESQDTTTYRSRKKYTRVDHSTSASFPLTIARYFVLNPNFGYSESWYKIHETDQSLAAGIDASTPYRRYRYNVGARLATKLYGTIYPRLFGLMGLRQVLEPSVSYSYVPKFDRHPKIAIYAGGVAGSIRKSQSLSFSLSHVYQAKIRQGEAERNLELVSVTHNFTYDYEKQGRKLSDLNTTFRSNLLKHIRFDAGMTHNMYRSLDPRDTRVDILGMQMTSFRVNGTLSLKGQRFLFDDVATKIPMGADSLSQLAAKVRPTSGRKGWDLTATYSYSESGKWTDFFKKTSSIRLNLHFNLTPGTQVTYSQYYDFVDKKTVTNMVSIVKTIHCWTGTFHWVPTGSTRGWGFKLYVTALPAVKIDNSQNSLSSGYLLDQR